MNSLLLDTHTFIWFSENDANLPSSIRETIEIAENVYVSIASLWEIAIKLSIGKLLLRKGYESIEAGLETTGITLLPISFADTVQVCKLPLHHRDPFDRMLIAQAINLSLAIVSRDVAFDAYPINRVWA